MPPPSILRFDDVTIEARPHDESAIWNVRFELMAGDLLLLLVEEEHRRLPLADAAQGVVPPLHGVVFFLDEDWEAMPPDRAAAQRGRSGRVFEDGGWVSNLDVEQNILLAQRHHTARPEAEIREEAAGLASMFSLPGLPRGRPAGVRRQDLAKAACIRAFLGKPVLIILESPTREVYADVIAPLVNAVQSARRRGAAVLWTTSDPRVWNNTGLRATVRCKMFGSQMHPLPRDG